MADESTTPRATARQSRRVEVFLDSAVAALAQKPIDRVTVQDICSQADSTRTTFYSYFGNLEGIYADLWLSRGRLLVAKILRGELLGDGEWDLLRATVALLSIHNRSSEIAEAVALDGSPNADSTADMWWSANTARLWLLASMIGWELSRPVLSPESRPIRHMELLRLTAQVSESESRIRPVDLRGPRFEVTSTRSQIMASAYSVLATAGIARTSIVRVARRAGLSAATCYSEFSDVADLGFHTFVTAQRLINEEHLTSTTSVGSPGEQLVALLMGMLSESRKPWREFRREVFLDASGSPRLGEFLRSQSLSMDKITGLYAQVLGTDVRAAIETSVMVHCLGLGFGVLSNLGVDTRLSRSVAVADRLLSLPPS